MAFIQAQNLEASRYNSLASQEFLKLYEEFLDASIQEAHDHVPSKTFAPSSFRCPRLSWFRLRGVTPDSISVPDKTMDFIARIGTACHEYIQKDLKELFQENWIPVSEYLKKFPINHEYKLTENGLETQIEFLDIPIRFACDGIIYYKGQYYLLEIKTSEFSTFKDMYKTKDEHIDQIRCYAALLNISHVLVLYQERQYGALKCYELTISDTDKSAVYRLMDYVLEMVDANLPPERLPSGDAWCSSSRCKYYKKCKEWG